MKAKIFSFLKMNHNMVFPSAKITRRIARQLDLDIVWDESIANEDLDVLMIVNGAYAFAGKALLEAIGSAISSARRLVWVQNDYTIIPPKHVGSAESPFRLAFRKRFEAGMPDVDFWTTCEDLASPGMSKRGHRCGAGSRLINWNALTVEEREPKPWADRLFADSLIYYGSYRMDREKYFDRYFADPRARVTISSPSKKFEEKYTSPWILHESKLEDVYGYLSDFGLGLYLEDRTSHKLFTQPANRFYEMLSAGLPMVFQPESVPMLRRAGYDAEPFEVRYPGNFQKFLVEAPGILEFQRREWYARALEENAAIDPAIADAWRAVQ